MKPVRPKTPARRPGSSKTKPLVKDPIEVFCRIRPLENRHESLCIRAANETTVVLSTPENSLPRNGYKEVHYSFKYVFDENTSQKRIFDHVALPLVQDLLQGTNGLLFTYGITSSGKTYTMAGSPQDGGLLPRCLDVIFNSIQEYQAKKYVFKPDRLNGFDIQSTGEAMLDQQKELGIYNKTPKLKRKEVLGEWSNRVPDTTTVENLGSDNNFSVFISYVEIYNNYIYDLLEEIPADCIKPRFPQSKMLREDSTHNMYVFNVTETEVKTIDESLELFCKGQQRRRISHTALNAESSRSHSVFTIRVTQAPLDPIGAEVMQDKDLVTVGQLSMVDLAGSERSIRTKNIGHKLREAGNINASLMALRTCIEALRENQTQGIAKMVPYRESKLTHLFKTFFEGEGKIRMVVCVNPRADDFDEATHVMRFAEMTQDVLISRPIPVSTPNNFIMKSGRGNMYREAVRKAKEKGVALNEVLEPVVYSLGPEFPSLTFNSAEDISTLVNLTDFLEARKAKRLKLNEELTRRQEEFRKNLMDVDKENVTLKQEKLILQMDLNAREIQVKDFEKKMSTAEQTNEGLKRKLDASDRNAESLISQLNENRLMLCETEKEMDKLRSKMQDRLELEKDRMRRVMEKRLAEKQVEIERQMCFTGEKFRQLREILNSGDWEFGGDLLGVPYLQGLQPVVTVESASPIPPDTRLTRAKSVIGNIKQQQKVSQIKANTKPKFLEVDNQGQTQPKSIAVANPRHRRSQSGDVWLEHKPVGNLDLGTVLQPKMKKKKSVSKLEVKDVIKADVSKYVLTHQEQDSKGEVETQLFKADVIPSAGGGAQVIFNDVEKLRQASPPATYKLRKRSAENLSLKDVEDRCAVAVECHGLPSKVMRKEK